ncbi:MAG: hypothetical protein ACK5JM_06705 [Rhodoblastus sp.]
MTRTRKLFTAAIASLTFAGAIAISATPAAAWRPHGGGHHGGGHWGGGHHRPHHGGHWGHGHWGWRGPAVYVGAIPSASNATRYTTVGAISGATGRSGSPARPA